MITKAARFKVMSKLTEYFHEESLRSLIKLLAENQFSAGPKSKLPQKVFRNVQKLIDSEGAHHWAADNNKVLYPETRKLVVEAREYKKKYKLK
jgi:hypothetical protein